MTGPEFKPIPMSIEQIVDEHQRLVKYLGSLAHLALQLQERVKTLERVQEEQAQAIRTMALQELGRISRSIHDGPSRPQTMSSPDHSQLANNPQQAAREIASTLRDIMIDPSRPQTMSSPTQFQTPSEYIVDIPDVAPQESYGNRRSPDLERGQYRQA